MVQQTVKITFADSEFLNLQQDVSWSITEGVSPHIGSFLVPVAQAQKIESYAKNQKLHNLKIEYGETVLNFQKLYFLGVHPSNDIYFKRFFLADRRWPWSRGHISRAYNVRTKLGDKFIPDTEGAVINFGTLKDLPQIILDAISYRTISLFPPIRDQYSNVLPRPWTIPEMIQDILDAIHQEYGLDYSLAGLTVSGSLILEDVIIDGSFDSALAQIMAEVPDIGCYVNEEGVLIFFNRTNGSETNAINSLTTEFESQGHIEFVDHSFIAPKEIVVLFTPEIEVRFDFEQNTGTSGTTVVSPGRESRYLENVAPCPDRSVTITGRFGVKRQALQGEYYTFEELIEAWGQLDVDVEISHETIKKFWVEGGMWSSWVGIGQADPRVDWIARIGCIQAHYLQTFRMNKNWRDKAINWQAKRVSLIDQASGAMAPSGVYADIAVSVGERGFMANGDQEATINTDGFWEAILSNATPNPFARMSIADAEQGIIEIHYAPDPLSNYIAAHPARVVNAPTWDCGDPNKSRYFYETSVDGRDPALDPEHSLSVILTGTPANINIINKSVSKNTYNGLYKVAIKPDDLKDIAPSVADKVKGARGERLFIKVNPGLQTARVAWSDDEGIPQQIEQAFGIGLTPPEFEGLPIMNSVNVESLAKTLAAAMYSKFTDRYKGRRMGLLQKVNPAGTVASVEHTVSADGVPSTTITLGDEVISPNFMNLLPKGVRAELLRQVKSD